MKEDTQNMTNDNNILNDKIYANDTDKYTIQLDNFNKSVNRKMFHSYNPPKKDSDNNVNN